VHFKGFGKRRELVEANPFCNFPIRIEQAPIVLACAGAWKRRYWAIIDQLCSLRGRNHPSWGCEPRSPKSQRDARASRTFRFQSRAQQASGSAGPCRLAIRLATKPSTVTPQDFAHSRIHAVHTLSVFAKITIPSSPSQQRDHRIRLGAEHEDSAYTRSLGGSDDRSQIPRRFD
jgi:hypothetical protein